MLQEWCARFKVALGFFGEIKFTVCSIGEVSGAVKPTRTAMNSLGSL